MTAIVTIIFIVMILLVAKNDQEVLIEELGNNAVEDVVIEKEDLRAQYNASQGIFFTSYNPEEKQTDGSPCIGAYANVCELAQQGKNPIALSRDMIWGTKDGYCTANCPFVYGDRIKLTSKIPECNFEGVVVDTMNIRYTNRGDIFKLNREDNTSCYANIYNMSR